MAPPNKLTKKRSLPDPESLKKDSRDAKKSKKVVIVKFV